MCLPVFINLPVQKGLNFVMNYAETKRKMISIKIELSLSTSDYLMKFNSFACNGQNSVDFRVF